MVLDHLLQVLDAAGDASPQQLGECGGGVLQPALQPPEVALHLLPVPPAAQRAGGGGAAGGLGGLAAPHHLRVELRRGAGEGERPYSSLNYTITS